MRYLLLAMVGAAIFPLLTWSASKERIFYIGTYTESGSQGIYYVRFNPDTGAMSQPELAVRTTGPSFLAFHPSARVLYAVNESTDKVSAFAIDSKTHKLTLLNDAPSGGSGPCHLTIDPTGRVLAVANYGGGSLATYTLAPDGRIGKMAKLVQYSGTGPDKQRQEGPHAHSTNIIPGTHLLLANDLGTDRTMAFQIDLSTAGLTPANPPYSKAPHASGPRHLAISKDARFVYVAGEMSSSISQYSLNAKTGEMRLVETLSTLDPKFKAENTCAEVELSPSGKTLYVSNRGEDTIAVFSVEPASGRLHASGRTPTGGKEPRHFTLDPSGHWLLAANQKSGNVVLFRVGAKGELSAASQSIPVKDPVCVLFDPSTA